MVYTYIYIYIYTYLFIYGSLASCTLECALPCTLFRTRSDDSAYTRRTTPAYNDEARRHTLLTQTRSQPDSLSKPQRGFNNQLCGFCLHLGVRARRERRALAQCSQSPQVERLEKLERPGPEAWREGREQRVCRSFRPWHPLFFGVPMSSSLGILLCAWHERTSDESRCADCRVAAVCDACRKTRVASSPAGASRAGLRQLLRRRLTAHLQPRGGGRELRRAQSCRAPEGRAERRGGPAVRPFRVAAWGGPGRALLQSRPHQNAPEDPCVVLFVFSANDRRDVLELKLFQNDGHDSIGCSASNALPPRQTEPTSSVCSLMHSGSTCRGPHGAEEARRRHGPGPRPAAPRLRVRPPGRRQAGGEREGGPPDLSLRIPLRETVAM